MGYIRLKKNKQTISQSTNQHSNKNFTAEIKWTQQIISKIFHLKYTEYTFFSAAHGSFPKIYYTLEHKTNLNKYKRKHFFVILS